MSNGTEKEKDWWDKADILTKIASGIILLIFTIVVAHGTEKIAAALKKGELIQKLIFDLTAPQTERIRQDLALIALDGSVGMAEGDSALVVAIVEKLFEVRPTSAQAELTNDTAFMILRKRSPERAQKLRENILKIVGQKDVQLKVSSPEKMPQSSDPARPLPESQPSAEGKAAAAVFSNILYIQFRGGLKRELIKELQKVLRNEGLASPEAVDRQSGSYDSEVRYFHEEDRTKAAEVATKATKFFEEKRCPKRFPVVPIDQLKSKIPKGQIELWISHSCPSGS